VISILPGVSPPNSAYPFDVIAESDGSGFPDGSA